MLPGTPCVETNVPSYREIEQMENERTPSLTWVNGFFIDVHMSNESVDSLATPKSHTRQQRPMQPSE